MSLDDQVVPVGIAAIREREPVPFFWVVHCPACGREWQDGLPLMEYHGHRCVESSSNGWTEVGGFGDPETPHLHVRCRQCSFTFTMQVADP